MTYCGIYCNALSYDRPVAHTLCLLPQLRVTAARPGVVNFELDIEKQHTNRLNILHGGTIASMVDLGGSLAVASRGLFATGVSTDLNGEETRHDPLRNLSAINIDKSLTSHLAALLGTQSEQK